MEKKYDRYGYDTNGFNKKGIHRLTKTKYDYFGYDVDGFNIKKFNKDGIHKITKTKYDEEGFNIKGYNKYGFDRKGIHKSTHTKYNLEGFDIAGYNKDGFNKDKLHKDTLTEYDLNGFNYEGYNSKGYNKRGFNKLGYHYLTESKYDEEGFDKYGYNKEGFNRNGINKFTLTKYDTAGYDINGIDKHGKTRGGIINKKKEIILHKEKNFKNIEKENYDQKNIVEITPIRKKVVIDRFKDIGELNYSYPINKKNILFALEEEEQINKRFCEYTVTNIVQESIGLYSVTLTQKEGEAHPFSRKIQIDEVMEGGNIWWEINNTPAYAEIFLVFPEEEKIAFRFLKGPAPKVGTVVRIYLPNYIEPLIKCWENNYYVTMVNNWLKDMENYTPNVTEYKINGYYNNWLRVNQKKAFNLLDMKAGLLWGPPGTGKTTTMSAMIAEYIENNPHDSILIVGNTNLAVDTIFTGFDKILDKVPNKDFIRKYSVRYGEAFNSKMYKDREYLLAKNNDEHIMKELFILEQEKEKIPNTDVVALANWQDRYDRLKKQLKSALENVVQNYSVIAMTSTVALYNFELLLDNKFNLVILEEASQINLCQALMLTLLGEKIIFTGDDKQLSPIVQSNNKEAQEYLGYSIFKYKTSYLSDKVFFLNEQSRMTENICKVVSQTFYNGELILAKSIPNPENWKKERKLNKDDKFKGKDVIIVDIDDDSNWSKQYGGAIRYDSCYEITKICENLIDHYDSKQEDINILTPFRAQKNMIKSFLKRSHLPRIKVNTIHKSQGSECHTIIFDPVDGESKFLSTKEAQNMINVTISRAKARLIVCLSKKDYTNKSLNKIAHLIAQLSDTTNKNFVPHISEFINKSDFPKNIVGRILDFEKSGICKVLKFDEKSLTVAIPNKEAMTKKISLEFLYKKYL